MKMKILFYTGLSIVIFLFSAQVPPNVEQPATNKFVVVLDAGHGGHDPGNLGNGYLEKNIALGIVLETGKVLEARDDIEVVYTRKDDKFVDLYVRGEIANRAKADLFVSVHCDSHSSDANGAGTFVLGLHANKQNFEIAKKENSVIYLEDNYETRYADYDINSPESIIGLTIMQEEFLEQSILLGKMVQDNFTKDLSRKDRKVKQAGFIVLHQTFMPSVLIETGFLTNKNEGAYLNSRQGQADMGKAIAEAIVLYKTNLRGGEDSEIGSTAITKAPEVPEVTAEEIENTTDLDENTETPQQTTAAIEKEDEGIVDEVAAESIAEEGIVALETNNTDDVPDNAAIEKEIKSPQQIDQGEKVEEVAKDLSENNSTSEIPTEQEVKKTVEEEASESLNMEGTDDRVDSEVKKTTETNADETAKTSVVFKVQILASAREIPLQSENFRGLSKISKEPYKNLYRYMYGQANSFEQAKLLKSNADLKGYTTSFIVAYKEGERIPVREAIKYLSE